MIYLYLKMNSTEWVCTMLHLAVWPKSDISMLRDSCLITRTNDFTRMMMWFYSPMNLPIQVLSILKYDS